MHEERLAIATIGLPVSGPSLADIARGAWTDILDIIAPASAPAGSTVSVTIKVKNLWTDYMYISTSGKFDNTILYLYPESAIVGPGATKAFTGSFTMPDKEVRVYVWSWYWSDEINDWYQDDQRYVDIALAEAVWQKLATKTITITPEVVAWQKLATKTITVTPTPVEWVKLATKTVTLTPVEIPPEYELIQHTIHPAAYVWEGDAEVCTIEFPLTPDQLPFTQWGGLKLAETFANAIEAEGNSLLEVKVWEDTTPVFWTNYRVEIKAAVASEEQGVAVWPWLVAVGAVLVKLPWAFIIKGTLTLIGIWLVGWVIDKIIKSVDRVIHKPSALTDEVIDALGREDLIPMILYKAKKVDYEVSPEELEALSDDGLRALLKELRDRQVREEFEWWPLVLIGGLGVLGVGAAVALAARPRE